MTSASELATATSIRVRPRREIPRPGGEGDQCDPALVASHRKATAPPGPEPASWQICWFCKCSAQGPCTCTLSVSCEASTGYYPQWHASGGSNYCCRETPAVRIPAAKGRISRDPQCGIINGGPQSPSGGGASSRNSLPLRDALIVGGSRNLAHFPSFTRATHQHHLVFWACQR